MKLNNIIAMMAIALSIVACDMADKEEGVAVIYLTGGLNGMAEVAPKDAVIDKEAKTMTFAFGISRSGLQEAKGYTVNFEVDNSKVPSGTVALAASEFTLHMAGETVGQQIRVEDGEVQKCLYLTIPEEVFLRNDGKKMAVHVSLSNPSAYELNPALSELNIVIDVINFLGAYEDITSKTLKNTTSPFDVTLDSPPLGSCEPYQHTPTEWTVNDAVKIHYYEGKWHGGVDARCWGNRNWLSAGNFDFFTERQVLDGKIYQSVELSAGDYRIEYDIAESAGGTGRAALVVAEGNTLPDFNKKETEAIVWQEFIATTSLNFDIEEEGLHSIGFVYYIPKGVQGSYAIKSIKLKRKINVFTN